MSLPLSGHVEDLEALAEATSLMGTFSYVPEHDLVAEYYWRHAVLSISPWALCHNSLCGYKLGKSAGSLGNSVELIVVS